MKGFRILALIFIISQGQSLQTENAHDEQTSPSVLLTDASGNDSVKLSSSAAANFVKTLIRNGTSETVLRGKFGKVTARLLELRISFRREPTEQSVNESSSANRTKRSFFSWAIPEEEAPLGPAPTRQPRVWSWLNFFGLGQTDDYKNGPILQFNPKLGENIDLLRENSLGNYTNELVYPKSDECLAVKKVNVFADTMGHLGHVTHFGNRMYYHPSSRAIDSSIPEEFRIGVNRTFTWLEAKNFCRKLCMEPISMENLEDYYAMLRNFAYGGLPYVWTAGRRCNRNSTCAENDHIKPLSLNGWFWTNSGKYIPTDVNEDPLAERIWARTTAHLTDEHRERGRQPDNAASMFGLGDEKCLIMKQYVNEPAPTLHDIPCHAKAYVICQTSPFLCSNYGINCNTAYDSR